MKELEYKDVAAFSDLVEDAGIVIDSLLHSNIDSVTYDAIIQLENSLHSIALKVRRNYEANSLMRYVQKNGSKVKWFKSVTVD